MRIYDLSQPTELHAAAELMERFSDTPMDYADASLVLLAEALAVRDILTLDRRGFSTYRTWRRHAFSLVLDSRPS
jgi:predicted nucleic acid-binding protein